MAYEDIPRTGERGHSVSLDARERAAVTGVEGVESFDDACVLMTTVRGALAVRGSGLRLEKLSLDSGEVVVEGTIDALEYEDDVRPSGGLLSRLFG